METQKILFIHDDKALGKLISRIFSQENFDIKISIVHPADFLEMDKEDLEEYRLLIVRGSFLRFELKQDFCDSLDIPVAMISGGGKEYEDIAAKWGCIAFIPTSVENKKFYNALFRAYKRSEL